MPKMTVEADGRGACAGFAAPGPGQESRVLVLRAERVFDGERTLRGVSVLIDGGRVAGLAQAVDPAPGWEVLDFGDATLLPGLIDTHVHLGGDGADGALDRLPGYTDAEHDAVVDRALRLHLAAGVTTVRDLGDRRFSVVERRDRDRDRRDRDGRNGRDRDRDRDRASAAPDIDIDPLPEILAAGPPLTSVGGHCHTFGGEIAGIPAIRAAVRERAARRVDVVKVMASGGTMTAGTDLTVPQFPDADLRALVDEAHANGLRVTAHGHALAAIEQAVAAGVDGVEHFSCLTADEVVVPQELVEELARRGVFVCPTIGVRPGAELPPRVREVLERYGTTTLSRAEIVARLLRAGARVASGTDGGINGSKVHGLMPYGLADLIPGGVTPAEALATGTSTAALSCGVGDRKGLLRPGFDADVLVVRGDATTDIAALTRVAAVFVRGSRAAVPA
jgi:imidazolonepropionase-like amidohydrolase